MIDHLAFYIPSFLYLQPNHTLFPRPHSHPHSSTQAGPTELSPLSLLWGLSLCCFPIQTPKWLTGWRDGSGRECGWVAQRTRQKSVRRGAPASPEEELEAACLFSGVKLRQRRAQGGPGRGSRPACRSPPVFVPGPGCSLFPLDVMCALANFRAHPSCQGTLSLQLFLSNGFLLPRYGFGFNNS